MKCSQKLDTHTDSGYRRVGSAEDVKGYGMRGLTLLRRGITKEGRHIIHRLDSICKSHRLIIRSSYGAELLSAAHGYDDIYPTIITLIEIATGVRTPEQIKQYRVNGGIEIEVTLTIDAEGVYKSLISRDLKTLAEKTLLGHVAWIREMLQIGNIRILQWCDTRDMTADGHTEGCIDRAMLLKIMRGEQSYEHATKQHEPARTLPGIEGVSQL